MTKRFLDWSDFASNSEALDLLKESMRDGLDFDAYGGTNRFIAICLTPTTALTDVEAEGYGSPYTGPTMGKGLKNKFKARILGDHSPHMFLPDPCALSVADANAPEALSAIAQHTDFIQLGSLNGHYTSVGPGDIVEVELKKNVFSYDLQVGKFIRLVARNASAATMVSDLKCNNLVKDFYKFEEASTDTIYKLTTLKVVVSAKDSLNFYKGQIEFLTALETVLNNKVDSKGAPIITEVTVTSGVRTIKEQAFQMMKIAKDDVAEFNNNYGWWGGTKDLLLGYGTDPSALPLWSKAVSDFMSRQKGGGLGHTAGKAVDIATAGFKKAEQLVALQTAIEDLGGSIHAEKKERWKKSGHYWERNVAGDGYNEHWHVTIPAKFSEGLTTASSITSGTATAHTGSGVWTPPLVNTPPAPTHKPLAPHPPPTGPKGPVRDKKPVTRVDNRFPEP